MDAGRGGPEAPTAGVRPVGRPWLGALAGLALGLGAVLVVAWSLGISREAVWRDLRVARHGPLAAAAAGALVLLALQSLRWWLVMRPVLALRYRAALQAMAVGFLFNVFLPARGGDLLRVQYLGKRAGVSRATLLGTELVDFGSDKLGWLVAFPLVCLLGDPPSWMFRAAWLMAGLALVGAAILVLMASRVGRVRADGSPWGPRWLHQLRAGFAVSHWKRLLAIELLVAPLPWLWESAMVAWSATALGLQLDPVQAFSVLTAFNVATAVPSPGNAGSFEAGGTLALTAMGVAHDPALTFVFLYHLTQVVPTCLAGALVLALQGERVFGAGGLLRARRPADAPPGLDRAPLTEA